ncbi:MAG: molecular chaperone SurA [Comamonadaceae bacterium]|nr:MAG: molecular chaperone SurA [Comamonadaceae bacterium]
MTKPAFRLMACLAGVAVLASGAQAQLRMSPQMGGSTSGGLGAARPVDTSTRPADFIVAVVNSEPITNNEVRNRLVRAEQQMAQQGAPMPPRDQLARQVLERLVTEKAQLQLARDNNLKVEESAVDAAEASVARQNQVSLPELRRRMAADGIQLSQFRADLRNQLLLQRLREREIEPRVRVSDLEVDQYIREQQGSTDIASMEINLAQVLVAVPEGSTDAQAAALQAKAQDIATRARAGEDFSGLARQFSDAPDRASGGVLGLRNAERYPPLFVDAVQALRAGGIAGPVRSGAGFHVLKVIEKLQGGLPGVNITQSHARHILLRPGPQLSESAARERLAGFRRRILAGQADFAALAKENSQDGSAQAGGDLGWSNPGQFVPEFEEALDALSPGQIAEPLTTRFGVHLIQLVERRENTLSQREQREIARNIVREKKLDEAYINWIQDVRARAYVEFRDPPQ